MQARLADLQDLADLMPDQADLLLADLLRIEAEIEHLVATIPQPASEPTDPYDSQPAVLIISAGVGGMEAADFARMLLRMYMRALDAQHIPYEIEELEATMEKGVRRATLIFDQQGAYGLLKTQTGIQRLTRVSPYNAAGKKQTSFANIQVLPLLPEVAVDINPDDLKWDTFHSGGPGGQGVNTTDSAVRLTHKPTGLTVNIQGRSQTQNKATALRVLAARITEKLNRERGEELADMRGTNHNTFGGAARTFNLTGGKYVKDHRTDTVLHDAQRVLDGNMGELL